MLYIMYLFTYVYIDTYIYIYIYMYVVFKKLYGTPKTYLSSKFNGVYIVFLNPFNSKT